MLAACLLFPLPHQTPGRKNSLRFNLRHRSKRVNYAGGDLASQTDNPSFRMIGHPAVDEQSAIVATELSLQTKPVAVLGFARDPIIRSRVSFPHRRST
jgi:hypothetical protein